jgi:hypothetical protein
VTVEDIDQILLRIASHNPKSSREVQSLAKTWPDADYVELVGDLYKKLAPREAKWVTRHSIERKFWSLQLASMSPG